MKKKIAPLILIIFIMIVSAACKKDNGSVSTDPPSVPVEKDYGKTVFGRTWWGTFSYPGQTFQYYAVSFETDSSMIWYQMSGVYTGKWSLADNHLTMRFPVQSVIITADLTADDKMINFTSNNNVTMIDGQMRKKQEVIDPEGTEWAGNLTVIGGSIELRIELSAGYFFAIANMNAEKSKYSRPAGNMALYADGASNDPWFGLITDDSTMLGTFIDFTKTWKVKRK